MAKVKLTKTELKAQKDALARYQRFLPMLQLKKSQLQMELQGMRARADELARQQDSLRKEMTSWIGLFADESAKIPLTVEKVRLHSGNIAGVVIPIFDGVDVLRDDVDLYETPAWIDDAADAAERLIALRAERDIALRQVELIAEELRTTSQRVNLFEKVKIPECKENIRVINVAIGDEQTSAVARGKIAKGRGKTATEPDTPPSHGKEVAE
ncbi:MAG: V-type ATP synthase subunit D [Kiritimatiellia bacterium]